MLNRMRFFLFCSILSVVFAAPSFAAPKLKIEPPAKEVPTGKSVVLKVQLEWPEAEGPYEFHSLEPKLENLTLEKQRQSQETGETVSQTFFYEFRPVKSGTAVIYPFEISYRKAETEPWTPIFIPEHMVKVVSNFLLRVTLVVLSIAILLWVLIAAGFKQWDLWKVRAAARNAPPPDPKQRIYAQAEEAIMKFASPDPKEKLALWANHFRTVVVTYYDVSGNTAPADILSFLKVKEIPMGDWNEISGIFRELTEMQFSRRDLSDYELARMQRTLLQYVTGKIIIGEI